MGVISCVPKIFWRYMPVTPPTKQNFLDPPLSIVIGNYLYVGGGSTSVELRKEDNTTSATVMQLDLKNEVLETEWSELLLYSTHA